MEFRLAVMEDLPQLKAVYQAIIQNMNRTGIPIWDDIYPCEFFAEDIKNNRLYALLNEKEILAAFALCESNKGEKAVEWKDDQGRALYIDRLGVNVDYAGQGIGSLLLEKAKEAAGKSGADYLRLFVVDINQPAIRLYEKCGFWKAKGVYEEVIDEELSFREYGFETAL